MTDDTSKPTPDPTVLTTEQMLRETENVREWARELIAGVREVTGEQFKSLRTQLNMIEKQRVEQKTDTKDAVDAAFAAAKEAVAEQTKARVEAINKSETQTLAALDALASQFDTGLKAIATTVDDLKNRVTTLETERRTTATTRDQSRMDIGQIVAILAMCFGAIGIAVAILVATR